jgi:hypothetical protein
MWRSLWILAAAIGAEVMMTLEAYMDTAVFGPHRWMIRGSDNQFVSNAQFTSQHDAEMAIRVGNAMANSAEIELGARIREMLP